MNAMLSALKALDLMVSKVTIAICTVSMMVIFVLFLMNVFVRFVPVYNFTQTDEWTQLFLVWVIFFGAQELVRRRSHFVVDVLTDRIKGKPIGKAFRIFSTLCEMVLYAVICYYGWVLVARSQASMQTIPWMKVSFFYACIPISAFFMTIYSIRDFVEALRMPWRFEVKAQA
ncbi:MAG: TRAP transporter small permease subunit [Succinivibrionaceae bacterium]|nr:TRAP transporter small permease subunit [Succinivibrionaceae bacterium]